MNDTMKEVTAAILVHEGKILIARRKADDKLANKWEFPGGKMENGETPEECLTREMMEEFGINVTIGDFFAESVYYYDHGPIKLMAYYTYWRSGAMCVEAHDAITWVSLDELKYYEFAPADIAIVKKLEERGRPLGL